METNYRIGKDEVAVLAAIHSAKHIEDIAREVGKDESETLSILTMLELKGRCYQMSGKHFLSRTPSRSI